MYSVAVRRDFTARHFLAEASTAEKEEHTHHYGVEVQMEGTRLDERGYLVDIADLEEGMEAVIASFRDRTLNGLPEFARVNPSIEHFSRIICQAVSDRVQARNVHAVTVRIWESRLAWASYRKER